MKKMWAGIAAVALLGGATACGDDSEEAGSDAYCELASELDEQEDFPTAEQFEQLQDAAPDEIKEELDVVVPIFVQGIEDGDPFAAFEDDAVEENLEAIEDYESDVCGLEGDSDDDEAAGEVNPEYADYCAVAIELDEQESFPTEEQFDRLLAAVPDEIADEVQFVVDKFKAGPDDPGSIFSDPEVGEAFETIGPFEEENCGIAYEDFEQDPSVTEADPDAAQVAVRATEYAFALDPEQVSAGPTTFTMNNEGEERHVMLLFKVADGATYDEVLASEGDEGVDGAELESDSAASGETAVLTTELTPGQYGMICYIPAPDGAPHVAKGMGKQFTVA